MTIQQRLKSSQTHFCLGLDPSPELLPRGYGQHSDPVLAWNRELVEATVDLVAAYKPNLAFYEALGLDGLHTLAGTVSAIAGRVPVIADAKRADIGNTSRQYARLIFGTLDCDAVTLAPYMGEDSLQPFLEVPRPSGLPVFAYVLALTSNPGALRFQSLECEGRPLYHHVLEAVDGWNHGWAAGRLGVVAGATREEQLLEIRRLWPRLDLLVPGVGAQGGDAAAVCRILNEGTGSALVNVSRAVLYDEDGDASPQAVRQRAQVWSNLLARKPAE
ncbi:MAG: orotidine-5'-phosphate decarboxylase [Calditrichaeota bacterium]|nr:orotidine-5'-phosphate decarboxylase [Calditrichota bacterium]